MTDLAPLDTYGKLTEPATLNIQRLLPGPDRTFGLAARGAFWDAMRKAGPEVRER